LLIHVSVGRWSVGVVIGFIVMDVSVRAVTAATVLSVRSGLGAILGCCFSHASCELGLELATIRVRKTVRPSMASLWMKGTLVLIASALTVVTAATAIVATIVITITITVAVVSTVAGIIAVVVVVVSCRASEVGQNLHEVNEFLSGCCRCELLGVSNERRLIVRTLTAKESFLDILLGR
jgi:hypothetical protein